MSSKKAETNWIRVVFDEFTSSNPRLWTRADVDSTNKRRVVIVRRNNERIHISITREVDEPTLCADVDFESLSSAMKAVFSDSPSIDKDARRFARALKNGEFLLKDEFLLLNYKISRGTQRVALKLLESTPVEDFETTLALCEALSRGDVSHKRSLKRKLGRDPSNKELVGPATRSKTSSVLSSEQSRMGFKKHV